LTYATAWRVVRHLEQRRGKGRDDYPVLGAAAVPSDDAFGRFLSVVMDEHEALVEIFHHLIEALRARLPGLGNKLAVDSKAIRSYGRPVRDEEKKQQDDRRRDVDANWGTKTYKGLRADGSLFADCVDPFIYDEHGQLYCVCPETGEQRELTFCGYEADRRTLKYRCPLRGLQKTLPSGCQWLRMQGARKLRSDGKCRGLRPGDPSAAGKGPKNLHANCPAHCQVENSLCQAKFGRAGQLTPRLCARF
jgi:hypothetical protein